MIAYFELSWKSFHILFTGLKVAFSLTNNFYTTVATFNKVSNQKNYQKLKCYRDGLSQKTTKVFILMIGYK